MEDNRKGQGPECQGSRLVSLAQPCDRDQTRLARNMCLLRTPTEVPQDSVLPSNTHTTADQSRYPVQFFTHQGGFFYRVGFFPLFFIKIGGCYLTRRGY